MSIAERARESRATELDRLGSSKAVLAMTDADLDTPVVLRAAAVSEATAAETFAGWAEAESDADARTVWESAAERERTHAERVESELGESVEADPDPLHEHLRGADTTAARVGGFVGRCLVAERTLLQVVNFFVNEADETRARLFRDLRADTEEALSRGETLVANVEESAALAAAERAVDVSYESYAGTLGEFGIDPKPLC